MSRNQKNKTKDPTNPYPDLPGKARAALVDYLYELRREDKGVRKVGQLPDPFTPVAAPVDTGVQTRISKIVYDEKVSPAKRFVQSLGMDVLMCTEVAAELNVSAIYLRRLMRHPDLEAPSYEVDFGKNRIYLYTREDVEELRRFISSQRTVRPRSKRTP